MVYNQIYFCDIDFHYPNNWFQCRFSSLLHKLESFEDINQKETSFVGLSTFLRNIEHFANIFTPFESCQR